MSWTQYKYIDSASRIKEVITIIEATSHGYATHYATVAAKVGLIQYLRETCKAYLTIEEQELIREALWFPKSPDAHITLQFLMDLVTLILYAKGIDVYEVILTTEEKK